MINLIIQSILLLTLPAIYAGLTAFVAWSQLEKPWLFLVCSAVVLYLIYVLAFYFAAPTIVSMDLFVQRVPSATPDATPRTESGAVEFSLINAYLRPIIIFSVASVPTLWLIAKYFRR